MSRQTLETSAGVDADLRVAVPHREAAAVVARISPTG